MSRSFALVLFKESGNVYWGCYNGTVDIMYDRLCTSEECYDKETDWYWPIKYCSDLPDRYLPKETFLDNVEIYADYGGGFYWRGKGNEDMKQLSLDSLNPWGKGIPSDGQPDWVKNFLLNYE